MSGFPRIGVGAALVLAATLLAGPVPAAAQGEVYVEVNPSTIQAGYQVGIRASCGDDRNPTPVTSDAFGQLMLTPHQGSALLTGTGTVPSSTRPGTYRVELRCASGATAATDLYVIDMAQPTRGPKTGGGATAADSAGRADPTSQAGPTLLTVAGVTALAAGAGLLVLRRRGS